MTDYGNPDEFEITWQNGHVDRVRAHQVSWPNRISFFDEILPQKSLIQFHAHIEGRWTLMLSAPQEDIRVVRNLTQVNDEEWLDRG